MAKISQSTVQVSACVLTLVQAAGQKQQREEVCRKVEH